MAEQLVTSCDPCEKRDHQRIDAVDTFRMIINDVPVRLDVCMQHADEFGRLLETLTAIGWDDTPSTGPRSRRGITPRKTAPELAQSPDARGCPMCFTLLSTPGNAGHHVRRMHPGRKIDEWSQEDRDAATREARKRLMNGTAQAAGEQ